MKSLIFCLTVSSCFSLLPSITLSALDSWFGETNERSKIPGRGTNFSNYSFNWLYILGSKTFALFVNLYKFNLEISHPPTTMSFGFTIGRIDLNGVTYVNPDSSCPKYVVNHWVSEPW